MKRIACIDTVYSVIDSFNKQLREGIPGDFLIHTMYDDFLATDPAPGQSGKFTAINHQRLRLDMQGRWFLAVAFRCCCYCNMYNLYNN